MSELTVSGNGRPLPEGFDPMVARVIRGNPTEEELAAVIAVIGAVFEAGSQADRPRDLPKRRSNWARSQRSLRWNRTSTDPGFGDSFGRS